MAAVNVDTIAPIARNSKRPSPDEPEGLTLSIRLSFGFISELAILASSCCSLPLRSASTKRS
jgi:hypothetical protein